jgi:hypothetical protein
MLKLDKLRRDIRSTVDNLQIIRHRLHTLAVIERERYCQELLKSDKYKDKTRLEPYGLKVYSQYEEDGIIQEIFRRIGPSSKVFVEFGVETGLENNTLKLLLEGWKGLWLEGNADYVALIRSKFSNVIHAGNLQVEEAFVDRDNINNLIGPHYKGEIDLISIDIDGNDIYILENLKIVTPRVVVIEYNGKFPPPISIAQKYDAGHRWGGTDYYGSSLTAITKVAERKGYSLVGCTLAGVNAFLVRNDLVADGFCRPFTAENHYHPARYFLWQTFVSGHPPDWGNYVTV